MFFSFQKSDQTKRSETGVFPRDILFYHSGTILLASLILAIARYLSPSPVGFGTHQQLGLPPCLFFKLTGIPCPNCGLTTSFAHAARLHFYLAFVTQPFGVLAFSLTILSIPLSVFFIRRRISWQDLIQKQGITVLLCVLLFLYLLSWVYKIVSVKMSLPGN